jgi:short-subunit dehydrogenase
MNEHSINIMKRTALIKGASSGIGLELAKIHAAKGDNLVLVARSITKLEQLKQELPATDILLGKELPPPPR